MNDANATLAEMAAEGAITAEERAQMILLSYPRRKSELLAPFAQGGRFKNLLVEQCALAPDRGAEGRERFIDRLSDGL